MDTNLAAAAVAKLIRADLSQAQRDGALDASLKFSVRTSRFAGGASVDVTVKNFAGETHTAEYRAWLDSGRTGQPPATWKTQEVNTLTVAVKKICMTRINATYRTIYNDVYLDQTGGLIYA